jgi:hypothetical protein
MSVSQQRFATSMNKRFDFLVNISVHVLGNRLIQNKVDAVAM